MIARPVSGHCVYLISTIRALAGLSLVTEDRTSLDKTRNVVLSCYISVKSKIFAKLDKINPHAVSQHSLPFPF